jgi:hypothetical protein
VQLALRIVGYVVVGNVLLLLTLLTACKAVDIRMDRQQLAGSRTRTGGSLTRG